jgi:hypothetical protein
VTTRNQPRAKKHSASKNQLPKHPCDRPDVRAIVFAIHALEHARDDELSYPDYMMHRRELHIRLADVLRPSDGGRFGNSGAARLDVQIYRELLEELRVRASSEQLRDLDYFIQRVLVAGLRKIKRSLRRTKRSA